MVVGSARCTPRVRAYLNGKPGSPLSNHGVTLSKIERFKRGGLPVDDAASFSSHSRLRAARVTPSGDAATRYSMMREVLLTYLSPILVDSVLERALHTRQLTPDSVGDAELAELASDVMVGLRLFVAEERLSKLMLQLADILGGVE